MIEFITQHIGLSLLLAMVLVFGTHTIIWEYLIKKESEGRNSVVTDGLFYMMFPFFSNTDNSDITANIFFLTGVSIVIVLCLVAIGSIN